MNLSAYSFDMNTVITALTAILGIGLFSGMLRAKIAQLLDTLTALAKGLTEQTEVTRQVVLAQVEVTRLLTDLNLKHTPEHADHAGFGTVSLRDELRTLMYEHRIFTVKYEADRKSTEANHKAMIELLKAGIRETRER